MQMLSIFHFSINRGHGEIEAQAAIATDVHIYIPEISNESGNFVRFERIVYIYSIVYYTFASVFSFLSPLLQPPKMVTYCTFYSRPHCACIHIFLFYLKIGTDSQPTSYLH